MMTRPEFVLAVQMDRGGIVAEHTCEDFNDLWQFFRDLQIADPPPYRMQMALRDEARSLP